MDSTPSPSLRLINAELVERAIGELRRGSAVVIYDAATPSNAVLACAAETIDTLPPPLFDSPKAGHCTLIITGRRAAVLGLSEPTIPAVQIMLDANTSLEFMQRLIGPNAEDIMANPSNLSVRPGPLDGTYASAVGLSKIARLLPAIVAAPIEATDPLSWADSENRICVSSQAIDSYERATADELQIISQAKVPLAACEDTRIVSFRPKDGGAEHLALVIGSPDFNKPVLTRLHSECFTGDLLGSLRCDCGDQLGGAIEAIAKEGSGVLLYLAQEGRGIGLVNKLRAYALQDQGFDTVDANEQLGFDDDERIYLPAVRMLRTLGCNRVRLLTNNPAKAGALVRHGIEVTERVPHVFPSNEHNRQYLQTKAKRSGHLF